MTNIQQCMKSIIVKKVKIYYKLSYSIYLVIISTAAALESFDLAQALSHDLCFVSLPRPINPIQLIMHLVNVFFALHDLSPELIQLILGQFPMIC